MHDEILTREQTELLSLVNKFSKGFGLVGGTAIALQIGHRRSIDFDLFTLKDFQGLRIRELIRKTHKIEDIFVENPNELTVNISGVKVTFYKYPFNINFSENFKNVIKMPDLLTLGAMKAFALGRRAKWKDYVDLYYIFQKYSFKKVSQKARDLFDGEFNEKLFREQLCYFSDINYSEQVEYLEGFEIFEEKIKESLVKISLSQ